MYNWENNLRFFWARVYKKFTNLISCERYEVGDGFGSRVAKQTQHDLTERLSSNRNVEKHFTSYGRVRIRFHQKNIQKRTKW